MVMSGIKVRFVADLEAQQIVANDPLSMLNNVQVDILSVIEWHT